MEDQTGGIVASARELGRSADPLLEQLAEKLGAEVLRYQRPVAFEHGGNVEKATLGDLDGDWELLVYQDPDGLQVTLNICLYPTRINWFDSTADALLNRPLDEVADQVDVRALLESSPDNVVNSCRAGLLNLLRRGNVWDVALPDWIELDTMPEPEANDEAHPPQKSCSCAAEDADGVCPVERRGQLCPEKEEERLLEPLDPTARAWAEGIVSLLDEMYSDELPESLWSPDSPYWAAWPESWQIETKIPLHIHVLLDDGSSWILPGLRDSDPSDGCYAHRRAAFRAWHAALGCSPAAVLVVDPQAHGLMLFPHFGVQLQTSSVEVWTGVSPALRVGAWQACGAHPETPGMVSTPVRLTQPC